MHEGQRQDDISRTHLAQAAKEKVSVKEPYGHLSNVVRVIPELPIKQPYDLHNVKRITPVRLRPETIPLS